MDLVKCEICHWSYPASLVNIFRSNTPENGKAICGICGLELTNQIHGVRRTRFDGKIAEFCRQQAVIWRRKHPYDDPAKKQQPKAKEEKNESAGN